MQYSPILVSVVPCHSISAELCCPSDMQSSALRSSQPRSCTAAPLQPLRIFAIIEILARSPAMVWLRAEPGSAHPVNRRYENGRVSAVTYTWPETNVLEPADRDKSSGCREIHRRRATWTIALAHAARWTRLGGCGGFRLHPWRSDVGRDCYYNTCTADGVVSGDHKSRKGSSPISGTRLEAACAARGSAKHDNSAGRAGCLCGLKRSCL